MFSNHSAHAPVLFQYVFDELWWPSKLLEMLLDSAVKVDRKEDKIKYFWNYSNYPFISRSCFLRFSTWNVAQNWRTMTSFEFCLTWRFWNTPKMLNLKNIWLRYLRLNPYFSYYFKLGGWTWYWIDVWYPHVCWFRGNWTRCSSAATPWLQHLNIGSDWGRINSDSSSSL